MAKTKWRFGMEELVWRNKIRGYLNPKFEWLSKVSDKEYARWEYAFRLTQDHRGVEDGVKMDREIWKEIEYKEEQYQKIKKRIADSAEKHREMDEKLAKKATECLDLLMSPSTPNAVIKNNRLTKEIAKDMGYKYESMTASTETNLYPRIQVSADTKTHMNGRVYPNDWHTDLDWMHGKSKY